MPMSLSPTWTLEQRGVFEEVDVEVDGAVEDGEDVREVRDLLHPVRPDQLVVVLGHTVVHLQEQSQGIQFVP